MVNSSTKFYFDNKWSDDSSLPSIKNVTLDSGLYSFKPIGEKTIIEDQIQGRDEPYLYNVDFKPLEFTINIAFENYETIDEVTKVITWLYNPNTYKLFKMQPIEVDTEASGAPSGGSDGDTYYDTTADKYYVKVLGTWTLVDKNAEFFGMFIGTPEYYYVGRNDLGYKKYIGYITCKFRANAPYGYTEILTNTTNSGDLETYPSFEATATTGGTYTITNSTNESTFKYAYAAGETLTFNGYTKVLSSSVSGKNPYTNWPDKDYLIFDSGTNSVSDDSSSNLTIAYSYRAPKYL